MENAANADIDGFEAVMLVSNRCIAAAISLNNTDHGRCFKNSTDCRYR